MPTTFATALQEARRAGRVLLDLADDDPARHGLSWDTGALEELELRRRAEPPGVLLSDAREAVAGYLAGHGAAVAPDRVLLFRSRREALGRVLGEVCGPGGEVLMPSPRRALEAEDAVEVRTYRLAFDERWRLDRRSLQRALSRRTRAILIGNPAEPTGAALTVEELRFLEALCAERGLVLVSDEALLDSALDAAPTVAAASRCLALQLGGLRGSCGLAGPEGDWLAVAGPAAQAEPLVARLAPRSLGAPSEPGSRLPLFPSALGRRQSFLAPLRARLVRNRSVLAAAALREAPWTLQWGGGWWAVLQVNPAQGEDQQCLALLEQGVAVLPGHLAGFPEAGVLLVSLLPPPEVFDLALARLEERLRDRLR